MPLPVPMPNAIGERTAASITPPAPLYRQELNVCRATVGMGIQKRTLGDRNRGAAEAANHVRSPSSFGQNGVVDYTVRNHRRP